MFSRRRAEISGGYAPIAAAGAAPAVTGIATIGACCCTTCSSVAAIAVVGAASGAGVNQLLLNNWYLSVFQLVVVGVSLMVQERAIRQSQTFCPNPPPRDARFVASGLLRLGLLVAGVTWSLSMFVEWFDNPPLAAGAVTWYHWIVEHQLLAVLAVTAAMLPREVTVAAASRLRSIGAVPLRVGLGLGALTWGAWVPGAMAAFGLGGTFNELFGYLGYPASWGAIVPDSPLGAALLFHWVFQHALLAGFALTFAISPARALVPLMWSVERNLAVPEGTVGGPPSVPVAA
jgi:hypothetical protein